MTRRTDTTVENSQEVSQQDTQLSPAETLAEVVQEPPVAAADTDSDVGTESATVTDPIAEIQATADENWNKYLRAVAELENVQKRGERNVENARKFAIERFAADLLGVCDSLEMGLTLSDGADIEQLLAGGANTLKLMLSTLDRFGISVIDPAGEPFDPEQHEAMAMQPSPDAEPGSVLTVFQKGYMLNGRLLRPARVVVAADVQDAG